MGPYRLKFFSTLRWHIVSPIRIPQTVEPTLIKMLLFQIFFFIHMPTRIYRVAQKSPHNSLSLFSTSSGKWLLRHPVLYFKNFWMKRGYVFFYIFPHNTWGFPNNARKIFKTFFKYMRAKHTCCAAGCCWSVCNTRVIRMPRISACRR